MKRSMIILLSLFLVFFSMTTLVLATEQDLPLSSCDDYGNCILYGAQKLEFQTNTFSIQHLLSNELRLIVSNQPTPVLKMDNHHKTKNGYDLYIQDIHYDSRDVRESYVRFIIQDNRYTSYCNGNECLLYTGQSVYANGKKVVIKAIDKETVRLSIGEEVSESLNQKGSQDLTEERIMIRAIDYNLSSEGVSRVYFRLEGIDNKKSGSLCKDSDNGLNPIIKGEVSLVSSGEMVGNSSEDFCSDKTLIEYYCEDNQIKRVTMNCKNSCSDGTCIGEVGNVSRSNTHEGTIKLGNVSEISNDECEGCVLDGRCYSTGMRVSGMYCDGTNFTNYLDINSACDNNYECKSNECLNDKCVDGSVFQSIIRWFSHLFSGSS